MDTNDHGWRNRIVDHGVKRADEFQAHPHNWRRHPEHQRAALAASLNSVGWVDVVLENMRTGHLLDGHERLDQALKQGEDTPVPYIAVDVSEDEAGEQNGRLVYGMEIAPQFVAVTLQRLADMGLGPRLAAC